MSQSFSLFINFSGECREALDFYAKAFESEVQQAMTYDEMPPDPEYKMPEEDKNRIGYAQISIFGTDVMFCDIPSGMPLVKGNNISPTLGSTQPEDIRRAFAALAAEGQVDMELQKTFWSGLYGMVTDKYGIQWQFSLNDGTQYNM